MVKNSPANAGDMGSISGSGRSPGEGYGNPFQYSCFENLMDSMKRKKNIKTLEDEFPRPEGV